MSFENRIKELQEYINNANHIAFLEVLAYQLQAVFQILEVKMDYIINMMYNLKNTNQSIC